MNKYLVSREFRKPRVFEVSHVAEYVELATWLYSNEAVLFRGQQQLEDWPLVPAIARDAHASKLIWRESDVLNEFKRAAVAYLKDRPSDDWAWLATAQHHGLRTRLLDWSLNPLAALWFAVRYPPRGDNHGIVWAYAYEPEECVYDGATAGSPFAIGRTTVYFPEHAERYIQAQDGVFTIHHKVGDDPGEFRPLEEQDGASLTLTAIRIRREQFRHMRYHLARLGITDATMFPGVGGVAAKLNYQNIMSADEIGTTIAKERIVVLGDSSGEVS